MITPAMTTVTHSGGSIFKVITNCLARSMINAKIIGQEVSVDSAVQDIP